MEVGVTLSANAGIALRIGSHRLWVDALHDRKMQRFSTLDHALLRRMRVCQEFYSPEYICYTHCHGDHYSEALTDAACTLWPNARVLAPEGKYGCVTGEQWTAEDNGLSVRFIKLPHEGQQYRDVAHYGIIIRCDGINILVAGDCQVCSEALIEKTEGIQIHLMILTFPWLALSKGREFLYRHYPDTQILLYHLPFEEDDVFGYRKAIKKAVDQETRLSVRLLSEPLQTQSYTI